MTKHQFPYIASGLGLLLILIVIRGSVPRPDGLTTLPLFTLLAMCEFGLIVNAVGTYLGARDLLANGVRPSRLTITLVCGLLVALFAYLGVQLWPR